MMSSNSEIPKQIVRVVEEPPSLPCAEQEQSGLLRLPPEIRNVVLRLLLVSKGVIGQREEYREQGQKRKTAGEERDLRGRWIRDRNHFTYIEGYRLTPAILATCQTLLHEGWPLLYKENVLLIFLHNRTVIPFKYAWSGKDDHARIFAPAFASHTLSASYFGFSDTPAFSFIRNKSFFEVISPFQNYYLDIDMDIGREQDFTLRDYNRALAPLLFQKNVKATFPEMILTDRLNMEYNVSSFLLLRCKSFELILPPFTGISVELISNIVTSSQPVVDVPKLMIKFIKTATLVRHIYLDKRGGVKTEELSYFIQKFNEVGRGFKVNKSCKLRTEFLSVLDGVVDDIKEYLLSDCISMS